VISQYAFAVVTIAAASTIFVYIAVAWRKAPRAARAMKWTAAAALATGILAGMLAERWLTNAADDGVIGSLSFRPSNPCAPKGFPAAEVGKTIVLTNQQHANDPNWVDPLDMASTCPPSAYSKDNKICEGFFLARHALGFDLGSGDTRKCLPNEEVAELCTGGDMATNSSLCKQALDLQRKQLGR
jgi:hypothetical protein